MKKELSPKQRDELLAALKARFDANKARHPGLVWAKVQARLEARLAKLWSLAEMERTGREPGVVNQAWRKLLGWDGALVSLDL
jgi:enoyl-CoA hydratase/carnithine racemase